MYSGVLEVLVVVVCSEDGIVWMGKVQKWEQQMMLVLAWMLEPIRSRGDCGSHR